MSDTRTSLTEQAYSTSWAQVVTGSFTLPVVDQPAAAAAPAPAAPLVDTEMSEAEGAEPARLSDEEKKTQ